MPVNNISAVKNCTGCSSCLTACSNGCITMVQDNKGFEYPKVSANCIECQKCLKVCPDLVFKKNKTIDVYGARVANDDVLKYSTSGGVFSALSDVVINHSGYVCGAIMDNHFQVKHICTNSKFVRDKMRGSKYVQSQTNDAFGDVIELLKTGHTVLFVGTPCQIAGIKNIANLYRVDENLITVDIMCHGVPSPGVFKNHILYLEEKYGKVISYKFRDKKKGWRGQNTSVEVNSKKILRVKDEKAFTDLYFDSVIIRPSCFDCKFSTMDRPGDITICDYWGIEKENPNYDDNKGVSAVFINSLKGQHLFNEAKIALNYFKPVTDSFLQPNMKSPTSKNICADVFWRLYMKRGIQSYSLYFKIEKCLVLTNRIKRKLRSIFIGQ